MSFAIRSSFWKSVGIIGGMIIGSGMFALPYAVWISGFWGTLIGASLALIAVLSIHLAYGEIVAGTEGFHRLPGYTKLYLGSVAGNFEKFAQILGFNIVLLVYGVLGGIFLNLIFGGGEFWWAMLFFIVGGLILLLGSIGNIGWLNFVLSIPLIAVTLLVSFYAGSGGALDNISFSGGDPFFAFGIFVFSLTGLSVIADARSLFPVRGGAALGGKDKNTLRKAIITGTLIPLALYFVFVFGVMMVSGNNITEDALSGLSGILGNEIIILGAIVGVLAMFTSFLALGYDLKSIYEFDAGIPAYGAWLLTALIPVSIYLFGAEDFIKLISVMGGLFIAFDGIFVVFILRKLRKMGRSAERFLPFGSVMQVFLVLVFILSIIYEFVYQIF